MERIGQSTSKVVVVDPCLSPDKAKEQEGKTVVIVSDIESTKYLVYFREIFEKPEWVKEILGEE